MSDSTMPDVQFNGLYDLARKKKYLTYDEVNEHLPQNVVAPAQIDEILTKLMADFSVELVASEKKIPLSEKKLRRLEA